MVRSKMSQRYIQSPGYVHSLLDQHRSSHPDDAPQVDDLQAATRFAGVASGRRAAPLARR
jgi:hypothetical protein